MQTMRESWTDERLDDLKQQMGEGFARVDQDIRELRQQMSELRRMMFQGFVASITITVTCFVGLAGLMIL